MKNNDKTWTEEGDFGTNYLTETLMFYFDSYELYNTLNKNTKPELYNCFDKGDEFGCVVRFDKIEHLKDFFKHLTEITELSYDEIMSITENNIWIGEAWDILEKTYSSEESERLMDELDEFVKKMQNKGGS